MVFDYKDNTAKNSHARLIELSSTMNTIQLAAEFGCSIDAVRRALKVPLGGYPAKIGRPRLMLTDGDVGKYSTSSSSESSSQS